jgi:GNAT superfamily N-acetyltransferase
MNAHDLTFEVAHTFDEIMQAIAIRAMVYVGEQNCPYDEEVDGNDLAGSTHIIARAGTEPVGSLRIRWFADFAKIERVALKRAYRDKGLGPALWWAGGRLAARKGYRQVLGHIEPGLLKYWARTVGAVERVDRPPIEFSDRRYIEVLVPLPASNDVIDLHADALKLLRPEGAWDGAGVLDRSSARSCA